MKHTPEILRNWLLNLKANQPEPAQPKTPFLNSKQRNFLKWKLKQARYEY